MDLKKEEKTQRAINKMQGLVQCAGHKKCFDSDIPCEHRVPHVEGKNRHCKRITCWVISENIECI
jgi:hypothetical protein